MHNIDLIENLTLIDLWMRIGIECLVIALIIWFFWKVL